MSKCAHSNGHMYILIFVVYVFLNTVLDGFVCVTEWDFNNISINETVFECLVV